MKIVLIIMISVTCPLLWAQDSTFRLNVLAYQWTTDHRALTFSWPGSSNTSCNGTSNMSGYVSNQGSFNANGTSASTCTSTYTPPRNQTIDIRKPVVFIVAETDSNRMVLTCTRNVRWSQCKALNPGMFAIATRKGISKFRRCLGRARKNGYMANLLAH